MTKGMYESIEIDAPAAAVYDVAADVASYPEWAKGVNTVEVLDADADGRVARASFRLSGFVKEIDYTLRYDHVFPTRLSWTAEDGGDVRELTGSYDFDETDGRTVVTYALRVEPNFPVPGFAMRQGERQIIGAALRGLKQRVEETL